MREVACVAMYEMKLQLRNWVFWVFENRKALHGNSLCGVNERHYEIPTDMSLNLQLNSPSWGSVWT